MAKVMITGELADVEILEPTDEEMDQEEDQLRVVCRADRRAPHGGEPCGQEARVWDYAMAVNWAICHADSGSPLA